MLRELITKLPVEDFYHTVVDLAGEALSHQAYEEEWGHPPSSFSDGYDFMLCLAVHLRSKPQPMPEDGHLLFVPQAARRHRPALPVHAGLSGWHRSSSLYTG
jgi:hypothetical protein